MEWFRLRTDSIGALASMLLCLVVASYLLSIRNKSKDGWRITGFFLISALVHALGFIANSTTPATFANAGIQWNMTFQWIQDFIIAINMVYSIWMIYSYRQNPFGHEMRWVLFVGAILSGMAWYYEPYPFFWTFPIALLSFIWMFIVLIRKAVFTSRLVYSSANSPNTAEKEYMLSIQKGMATNGWQALLTALWQPANQESKAYRSLGFWCLAFIVFLLHIILFLMGISYDYEYWILVHHALILILPVWLAFSYINYAKETTTFLAKLVFLFLSLTLFLLGLIGFLLYGEGTDTELIGEQQQKGLNTLALLIPLSTLLIVIVVPFFLRTNLLRPLNYMLQGVRRVNAGDLQTEVPVEVNDEIGYLTENFNHMTDSLRCYSEQMEGLVAQRTSELEQQKEALIRTLDNLKLTQTQLIQREKMASLGELTAGIAHEIQNPLNFINNFSEVSVELLDELREERHKELRNIQIEDEIHHDIEQNLHKINQHGQRADAIVKGMLQHSRTSSGEKQLTDINALAEECLRLSYQGLKAKDTNFNANLITDFHSTIKNVKVVPQEIGRVLLNLYNNAFYATQQKKSQLNGQYQPEVKVSTSYHVGKIEIKVRDNGCGIPETVKNKIFQPFFTTKPTGQGTGLGLSLSYDIITKGHGGDLKVETKEGEYSEFIIILPL